MSGFEVRTPTAEEIFAFYGKSILMKVIAVDGKILAAGGFVERDGRIWAYGDVIGDLGCHALRVVRACRAHLHAAGYPKIYAQCNSIYPTARQLLELIGFRPTRKRLHGLRVYEWQA